MTTCGISSSWSVMPLMKEEKQEWKGEREGHRGQTQDSAAEALGPCTVWGSEVKTTTEEAVVNTELQLLHVSGLPNLHLSYKWSQIHVYCSIYLFHSFYG